MEFGYTVTAAGGQNIGEGAKCVNAPALRWRGALASARGEERAVARPVEHERPLLKDCTPRVRSFADPKQAGRQALQPHGYGRDERLAALSLGPLSVASQHGYAKLLPPNCGARKGFATRS